MEELEPYLNIQLLKYSKVGALVWNKVEVLELDVNFG